MRDSEPLTGMLDIVGVSGHEKERERVGGGRRLSFAILLDESVVRVWEGYQRGLWSLRAGARSGSEEG